MHTTNKVWLVSPLPFWTQNQLILECSASVQSQVLSPKAKENLQRNAESRQKDNKFEKLQPTEKKVFGFNPEKIERVPAEFNGKKSIRYRYTVTDPNDSSNQERYLEVGKRTSEDIDAYLSEGKTLLKIQRFGLGKDTRYHVTLA